MVARAASERHQGFGERRRVAPHQIQPDVVADLRLQSAGGVAGDDPAGVEHGHPVEHRFRLEHVVGHQHHGDTVGGPGAAPAPTTPPGGPAGRARSSARPAPAPDESPPASVAKAASRRSPPESRADDAAGELVEPELADDVDALATRRGPREAAQPAGGLDGQADRHVGERGLVLRQVADERADPLVERRAEQPDVALVGTQQADELTHQRRLPGAVRPEQTEDVTGGDVEVDPVVGHHTRRAGAVGTHQRRAPGTRAASLHAASVGDATRTSVAAVGRVGAELKPGSWSRRRCRAPAAA